MVKSAKVSEVVYNYEKCMNDKSNYTVFIRYVTMQAFRFLTLQFNGLNTLNEFLYGVRSILLSELLFSLIFINYFKDKRIKSSYEPIREYETL